MTLIYITGRTCFTAAIFKTCIFCAFCSTNIHAQTDKLLRVHFQSFRRILRLFHGRYTIMTNVFSHLLYDWTTLYNTCMTGHYTIMRFIVYDCHIYTNAYAVVSWLVSKRCTVTFMYRSRRVTRRCTTTFVFRSRRVTRRCTTTPTHCSKSSR